MDELVAWLRACIDEDARIAKAAFEGPWRYNPSKAWTAPPLALGVFPPAEEYVAAGPLDHPTCVASTGPADDEQSMADAAHIARWDPARVLAEVEAKRRILDAHLPVICTCDGGPLSPGYSWPCFTLLAVAQVFASRPGFKDEWRLT